MIWTAVEDDPIGKRRLKAVAESVTQGLQPPHRRKITGQLATAIVPSTNAEVQLPPFTPITLIETKAGWAHIAWDGTALGYVPATGLHPLGQPTAVPAPKVPAN